MTKQVLWYSSNGEVVITSAQLTMIHWLRDHQKVSGGIFVELGSYYNSNADRVSSATVKALMRHGLLEEDPERTLACSGKTRLPQIWYRLTEAGKTLSID